MRIEIYYTGGHTYCSCFAYFPEDKVVITGDLVFSYQFPYGGDITCNPDKWIKSLDFMLSLDADTFIPGHGPVVGKTEVKKQLDFFLSLKNEINQKLKNISLKRWFDHYKSVLK